MLLAMMVNFVLTPAMSLSPLLVADHFGGDAFQLAWFNSSFGIGLVAGGLILGAWGGFKKRILTTMMGLIGLGIGFGAVGLLPPSGFWFTVPAGLFAGIMLPMVNGPVRAILQAVVDPDKQGRVYTLLRSAGTAMTPIGLLIAGPVADAIGVTSWFVIGGAGCALAGIASFFVRPLLNIEAGRVPASEEIAAQGAALGTISTSPGEVQGD
jgi:DHA3 family macrolide efflux protein-like MFS transporter